MAIPKLFNLARMSTATTGSGTITLGSAVSGFLSFASAGVANADIIYYAIKDGSNSEEGYGTYTTSGTTLTRNVVKSTNSDAAISLSGSAEVFITALAEGLSWGYGGGPRNYSLAAAARTATITVTIASPAVVTWTAHGLAAGESVIFSTSGALPTGITAGTVYYVISAGLATDAFEISTSVGGAAVNTSGTQSGTHTGYAGITISLKDENGSTPTAASPILIPFGSATGTTGSVVWQAIRASTTLVISSGSTMGVTSSTAFRIWVVLFDDGGTLRLGAINCSTATQIYALSDDNIVSAVSEGGAGAADSAGVFYAGATVTSKAYRILGYLEWSSSGLTAGTWTTTNLSLIRLYGPGVSKPGDVVQNIYSVVSSAATGTTQIPADDTIPQKTEGDQYMSQAVTPTSAANILAISAHAFFGVSALALVQMALFQDSTSNALSANWSDVIFAAGYTSQISLKYWMRSQTTSSTTFNVRVGGNASATFTFNGNSGTRVYGGVANSFVEIQEIMG